MITIWDILIDALLTAWGAQAVLATLQARKLWRRLHGRARPGREAYRPPAVVIMPFKGVDPELEAALDRLFTQDYPDYRLMLVVDSEADPAYGLLQRVVARHPQQRAEMLVAGEAGPREGQKIHNQLFAIDRLLQEPPGETVWVFADSDAIPGPRWLADMVGPLKQRDVTGATTGYRWLVPAPPLSIWSHLASVINASVASMLCSREKFNAAWGGSMAVRAQFAIDHNLRGRLTGALTDDFPLTAMCREAGRRVYFVARCLVPTPVSFTFASLSNFAYRQYLITRIYSPRSFCWAMVLTWLYVLGLIAAVAMLAVSFDRVISGDCSLLWIARAALAGLAIAIVFVSGQLRTSYRLKAVREAFDPQTVSQLRTAFLLDRWATPLWMTLHALIVLRGAFGRTMVWRGIRYMLRGPNDVERL